MKKLLLAIMFFIIPAISKANVITMPDQVKNLTFKEGVMWDFQNKRFLNTLGIEVLQWKGLALNAAYIGVDGAGAVVDYSLASLPLENTPILKYAEYAHVGYGAGRRTLTSDVKGGNPDSDNQFIHGPVLFCKFKF